MAADRARWTSVVVSAALLLGSACGDDAARAPATIATAESATAPRTTVTPVFLPTADALRAVIDGVNASEVSAAQLAVQKATDTRIRQFASALASAHRQRVTDLSPVGGSDVATRLVAPLRELEQHTLAELVALPRGITFDTAYLASQVRAHERVLTLLDGLRVPDASTERAALLSEARAEVRRHLERAQTLQHAPL